MSNKKDCMVQVCLRKRGLFSEWGDVDIVENTDLITRKKADELWDKWYPKVLEQLSQGAEVEMGIWINCKDNTDYHTFIGHIDSSCEVEHGRIYQIKKTQVKKDTP